jgi:hypothetical protein
MRVEVENEEVRVFKAAGRLIRRARPLEVAEGSFAHARIGAPLTFTWIFEEHEHPTKNDELAAPAQNRRHGPDATMLSSASLGSKR